MNKQGIYEFISKQRTSIISSVDEEGYPATRALIEPRKIDGNDIYFASYTSSNKVRHYVNNPKACVYFFEKGRQFKGVTIKGTMEICTDQAIKDKLWRPTDTRFYREGITDPEYCILKFTGIEAQWFCNFRVEKITL